MRIVPSARFGSPAEQRLGRGHTGSANYYYVLSDQTLAAPAAASSNSDECILRGDDLKALRRTSCRVTSWVSAVVELRKGNTASFRMVYLIRVIIDFEAKTNILNIPQSEEVELIYHETS